MANTGNIFPGAGANVDRGGTSNVWANPGNVVSDNATTTDATVPTDYLVCSSFDFSSIPDGSTINGVTVRVEAHETGSGASNYIPQLISATTPTLIGSPKSAVAVSGATPTVSSNGGVSDVWGATLNTTVVKAAGFGVAIWSTDTTNVLLVDYVTIAIEYTEPAVNDTEVAVGAAGTSAAGSLGIAIPVVGIEGLQSTAAAGVASVEVSGSGHQIEPVGIASGTAFGAVALNGTLAAVGFANSQSLGAPAVQATVASAGIASTNAFGSVGLSGSIAPVGVTNTSAFGSVGLHGTIAAVGIAATNAVGVPTISIVGSHQINPVGFPNTQSFGTLAVNGTIAAFGIPSSTSFGAVALNSILAPVGIAGAQAFGTVALRGQIAAVGFANTQAFGSVQLRAAIEAVGFANESVFGTPTLGGDHLITANGFANASAFGTTGVLAQLEIVGFAVPAAQFGTVQVRAGLAPTGISSTSTLGSVSVHATVEAIGLQNVATFGEPFVGSFELRPAGFANTQSFGVPTVVVPKEESERLNVFVDRRRPERRRERLPHTIETRSVENESHVGIPFIPTLLLPESPSLDVVGIEESSSVGIPQIMRLRMRHLRTNGLRQPGGQSSRAEGWRAKNFNLRRRA